VHLRFLHKKSLQANNPAPYMRKRTGRRSRQIWMACQGVARGGFPDIHKPALGTPCVKWGYRISTRETKRVHVGRNGDKMVNELWDSKRLPVENMTLGSRWPSFSQADSGRR
jgi:hypothetical protein